MSSADPKKTKARSSYSSEYKENVCQLIAGGERQPRELAMSLGIPPSTVYGWLRARAAHVGFSGDPGPPLKYDLEQELEALTSRIARLESQERRLEEEFDSLKRAAEILANEEL